MIFKGRRKMDTSLWILILTLVHVALAFIPLSPLHHSQKCGTWISSKPNEEDEEELARKMALVRSLQSAYYKSNSTAPSLEKDSGILRNLPLWRVQWTELPGRSNILNVHEPIYTNMFETILYGPKPWYVGHLYLPGGSKNLKSDQYCYQLKSWEDDVNDENRIVESRSAVVGTLLCISDYRRLSNGRLILLVQGLERFVVVDCVQELPYSIANVQVLPDFDEVPALETEARPQRASAVLESFRYHKYEYDVDFNLPLPDSKYLSVMDIWGPALADVLPFVPYSNTVDPSQLGPIDCVLCEEQDEEHALRPLDESSLESRLLKGNILRDPPSRPELTRKRKSLSLDELEDHLWTALDDFCRASRYSLPLEVLCLIPPNREWPKPVQHLSANYPSERRQRRLSFAASAFLERTVVGADLRQAWLETPSTKARLR